MKNLFEFLEKSQRTPPFSQSEEQLFFNRYQYLLSLNDLWARFSFPKDAFEVVRANIILRSLLSKEAIEKRYKAYLNEVKKDETLSLSDFMAEEWDKLPSFSYEGECIYVPILPVSLNHIYGGDLPKLTTSPYNKLLRNVEATTVDPFDYYNFAVYDSPFTRLVKVQAEGNILAMYDYDAEALYFINDQGRLLNKICFFDRAMKRPIKTHVIARVSKVAEAYFAGDERALIETLIREKLVSETLLRRYQIRKRAFAADLEAKR